MSAADALENTEAVQKVVTPADLAFSPLWHGLQGYGAVTRDMHMRLGDHMKEEEERKISTGSEARSLVRLWFIHPSRLKRQENVLPLLYLPRIKAYENSYFRTRRQLMPLKRSICPSCKLHLSSHCLVPPEVFFLVFCNPFPLFSFRNSIDLSLPGRHAGHGEQRKIWVAWHALRSDTALPSSQTAATTFLVYRSIVRCNRCPE